LTEEEYGLFSLNETAIQSHKFSMRRSHLEVRMDILSCVKSGAEKPTQIMYKANLSWTALKDHLTALEQAGLLATAEYGNRRRYVLTDKGFAILMAYAKILDEMKAPAIRKAEAY